jgi:transketolase
MIVDHNRLQSDIWVKETSDLGDLEAKFDAFGWQVARCNGHDFAALAGALQAVKERNGKPKVIIADTVKGRGVSFMESTFMPPEQKLYRFHSGAPDPDIYARAAEELIARANAVLGSIGHATLELEETSGPQRAVPTNPESLIPAYSKALIAAAERDRRIVALDGDLVLDTGLIPFRERFPRRFLECGIAEQDMVSQAGGMALQGLKPVVHSFACFLASRPAEQIYNNASERTKVVYVGSLAGLVPGGPGHSHQAVNDIALLGSIPDFTMVEPCCAAEVAPLLDHLLQDGEGSGYLRLVSVPRDIPYSLPRDYRPRPGAGVTLREGRDGVVIAYGPILLPEAWHAADMLSAQEGVELAVVNLPWLNRIDPEWLRLIVKGRQAVFTLDNHLVRGGQGTMVATALAEHALDQPLQVVRFGLRDFPACGQNAEVLRAHGLDAGSLARSFADVFAARLHHSPGPLFGKQAAGNSDSRIEM